MEVAGRIKAIFDTETIGSNGFRKRELLVTTDEQYPQHVLIQFNQDKTEILNKYSVGQNVKVSINLRGREWVSPKGETKYFNTIEGWRIEAVSGGNQQQDRFEPATNYREEDHDNLPF